MSIQLYSSHNFLPIYIRLNYVWIIVITTKLFSIMIILNEDY